MPARLRSSVKSGFEVIMSVLYNICYKIILYPKELILSSAKNVSFTDFTNLIKSFGFCLSRVEGSHHIFIHPDVRELVNIQNVKGQAKPYQIKQFLGLVEKYSLKLED
jgi:predicted RNA binding protein YcfA (HicA-like mRNA interferase family)